MFARKNIRGISLIELMLGVTLSTLVINILFEIYLASQNNHLMQNNLITMQENVRLISQIITNRIRMSGYAGCVRLSKDFPLKNHLMVEVSEKTKVQQYKNNEIKPNTDAMTIWYVNAANAILTHTMQDYSVLHVKSSVPFPQHDKLLVSDCVTADIIEVKQASLLNDGSQTIVSVHNLSHLYAKNTEVSKLDQEHFFVSHSGRFNEKHQPIYALYEKKNNDHKLELAEGIDAMQIKLALIENHKIVERSIDEITDATQVIGVSLAFHFSSNLAKLSETRYIYVALR